MRALLKSDTSLRSGSFMIMLIILCALSVTELIYFWDTRSFSPFFFLLISIMSGVMPVSNLMNDKMSGWLTLTGALPMKRTAVVDEKYVLSLLGAGAFVLWYSLVSVTGCLIFGVSQWDYVLSGGLICLGYCLIGTAIAMPWACGKSVSDAFGVYFLVILGISMWSGYMMSGGEEQEDLQMVNFGLTGAGIFAGATVILFFLSWVISRELRKRKEWK